ncbi:MAG: hypothetical protein ACP5JR_06240 [Thermoplasmata archaeon]
MAEDWFQKLEKELDAISYGIESKYIPDEHASVAKELAEIFFNIWLRFNVDFGIEMELTPWQWEFVVYEGQKHWRMKSGFDFGKLYELRLTDRKFEHSQAMVAYFTTAQNQMRLKVVFLVHANDAHGDLPREYEIYSANIKRMSMPRLWKTIEPLIKAWYEAHIRNDQRVVIDFCERKFSKQLPAENRHPGSEHPLQ